MAKPSGLWLRKRDGMWMTTIHGLQHKLSKDKAEARNLTRTREQKETDSHNVQVQHLKAFCDKMGRRDQAALKVYEIEEWLEKMEAT